MISFMLWKLFAMVDRTAVPDNADALQNQEVLQPGLVITIYVKVNAFLILFKWTLGLLNLKSSGIVRLDANLMVSQCTSFLLLFHFSKDEVCHMHVKFSQHNIKFHIFCLDFYVVLLFIFWNSSTFIELSLFTTFFMLKN